ncbi:MAG: DUF523 domain-containing protein [Bacilli bacterium]|nr:DUF523 domain-containing protein [Bacilli bacterium]MBN2877285.1 DUF523 domain-containing protein [Bacilli bacterium]
MKRDVIGVSACLLGLNCKYNGLHNLNFDVIDHIKGKEVVLICPEVFGGLGTPRIPSEIQADGRVLNKKGLDVSEQFKIGTLRSLDLLQAAGCNKVILKDGSPSCGYKTIYDGTFSHLKIKGMGIAASRLLEAGFEIIDLDT